MVARKQDRDLNGEFELLLCAEGIGEFVREYRAVVGRRFKYDFAWPNDNDRLLVEIQGGTWVKSGHTTGTGIRRDCEKGNLAQLQDWVCLHFTADMIDDGTAIRHVKLALERARDLRSWRR